MKDILFLPIWLVGWDGFRLVCMIKFEKKCYVVLDLTLMNLYFKFQPNRTRITEIIPFFLIWLVGWMVVGWLGWFAQSNSLEMFCSVRSHHYEPIFQILPQSDKNYQSYSIFSFFHVIREESRKRLKWSEIGSLLHHANSDVL